MSLPESLFNSVHCCHVQVGCLVLPLLPGHQSGLKKVKRRISKGGWHGDFHHWPRDVPLLRLDLSSALGESQPTLEDGMGVFQNPPSRRFAFILQGLGGDKGRELLDRKPGMWLDLRGHLLGSIVPFRLLFTRSAKQFLPERPVCLSLHGLGQRLTQKANL